MSDIKLLGSVTPVDGVGKGGISIKPNKVSDLINPSTSQIDVYNVNKSYKKGEFVLVKEKRDYVIFQAIRDTGYMDFEPEDWKRYSLGDNLDGVRSDLAEATSDLMAEIVKGSGASKFKISGMLDWETPSREQSTSVYYPFAGLADSGYPESYNGVLINNTVITLDMNESIDLGPSPKIGTEYDLIFIEAFRVLEDGIVTMKHIVRSFALTQLEYQRSKINHSYFLGLSESRVRFIQAQGGLTSPLNEPSTDDKNSNAYRFSTFLSAAEREDSIYGKHNEPDDTGVWIAGDGTDESKEYLNTVDGYSYAIPVSIVKRRNTSKGSRTNPNGADEYFEFGVKTSTTILPGVQSYLNLIPYFLNSELESGVTFTTDHDPSIVTYMGVEDSNGRLLFKNDTFKPIVIGEYDNLISTTTNPFNRYSNLVEPKDVISIQQTLVSNMDHYNEVLDSNFNKFMRGELLDVIEDDVIDVFESAQLTPMDIDNLIPVVTDEDIELVNLVGHIENYPVAVSYSSKFSVKDVIDRETGWHELTIVVSNTISASEARIIIPTGIRNLKRSPNTNIISVVEVDSTMGVKLKNSTSSSYSYTDGFIYGVSKTQSVMNTETDIQINFKPPTPGTYKIRYRNLRLYEVPNTIEVDNLETYEIVNRFPFVQNTLKCVQNIAKLETNENVDMIETNAVRVTLPNELKTVKIASWRGDEQTPFIRLKVKASRDTELTFDVKEYGTTTQTVTIKVMKTTKEVLIDIPYNNTVNPYLTKMELTVTSSSENVLTIRDISVTPRFAHNDSHANYPYGTWNVSPDETNSHVHKLTSFDRYRKVWSNKPSSSTVNRTIFPRIGDNDFDVNISVQKKPGEFSSDDTIQLNSGHVIGPVVNTDVLANASRVISVSDNIITLSNTVDLLIGETVNIFNPYSMNSVVSNVKVLTLDKLTNAVTFDTEQSIAPGYLVLETMTTPFIPTLDSSVNGSWVDINTKNPLLKLKNLTPDIQTNPFSDVVLNDFNKTYDNAKRIRLNDWLSVSCGLEFNVALKRDGTLWSWGGNTWGQLGDGTKVTSLIPTKIGTDSDWLSVSCGLEFNVALKRDGTLWSWGGNTWGQLGDGTTFNKLVPTKIGTDDDWSSISCGDFHTMAIKKDGTLWSWGLNSKGQLGDGTTVDKLIPTKIGTGTDWLTTSGGYYHTVALKKDGTLWSWGNNVRGQLGDGTTVDKLVPIMISPDNDWLSVVCGGYYTLAIKKDGTLWSWGLNEYGQLGDGTTVTKKVPTKIGTDDDWSSISCGDHHVMGLKKDGTLWSWGGNQYGQLGDGTTTNRLVPTKIGTDTDWSSVSCGYYHTVALKKDGTLWSWGLNTIGQLGLNNTLNGITPNEIKLQKRVVPATSSVLPVMSGLRESTMYITPDTGELYTSGKYLVGSNTTSLYHIKFTNHVDWLTIITGQVHSVALKKDGSLWSWGENAYGQLGNGITVSRSTPTRIGTDTDWLSVSCGANHTMALKKDGSLWSWGSNAKGQLGDGGKANKLIPTKIGTDTDWSCVSCGDEYTVALKKDGTLWSWGTNGSGQLGDGTTTEKLIPTKIGNETNWLGVSCGSNHILSLKKDGTLWAWGNNSGQLGDGTTTSRLIPTKIGTDTDWLSTSCGFTVSIALKKDGTLWAWGVNDLGQLGDNTRVNKTVPTKIGTDTNWLSVSCGASHTMALKKDGTLWSWGNNASGQLGDGTTTSRLIPTYVKTIPGFKPQTIVIDGSEDSKDWLSISSRGDFNVALKKDGTLWSWGRNSSGQLGDGTTTSRLIPTKIGVDSDWLSVSCGSNHTTAIKKDGTLWAWGLNGSGQLGDGTTVNKLIPTRIGIGNDWLSVSCGPSHTVALKKDGTLWSWGLNGSGQLGDGTTVNKTSPVKIGTDNDWLTISCGANHNVAIKKDGTLWSWGLNTIGQLGDGTTVNKTSPVKIGTETNWSGVSCGQVYTLAIKKDGTLWAWGLNEYGQLGDGTTVNKKVPTKIGMADDWLSVSCGDYHTMALKKDGSSWSWGNNYHGQLGDGTTVDKLIPTKIGTGDNWSIATCGSNHSILLDTFNTLHAVGLNDYRQLGNPSLITGSYNIIKVLDTSDRDWLTISCGYSFTVALKKDGTLWAWGNNGVGQLGDGGKVNKLIPTKIGTDLDWLSVSCGDNHTVAIKKDGTLWSWGLNTSGQLGDGTTVNKLIPTKIGTDLDWLSVSCGADFTVALKKDGTLWSWGGNNWGVLGDGTTISKSSPAKIGTSMDWTGVSCGSSHTLAIKKDGSLWSWGLNFSGQLGDGTETSKSSPAKIGTSMDWTGVSCGSFHTVALKKDGTLWSWGSNEYGQLGNGTTGTKLVPTKIGTESNWLSISCRSYHTMALKKDGTLWSWGYNKYGQLGDGTTVDKSVPSRIGNDDNWLSVSSGVEFVIGITNDDSVISWGSNDRGQLGNGSLSNEIKPVVIISKSDTNIFSDWKSIYGIFSYVALKKDGTLWTWGENNLGQLGDGTTVDKLVPTKMAGLWLTVSAGTGGSRVAIKKDGTLWSWGSNNYGQLGDGTTVDKLIPTKIGTDTNWMSVFCGQSHTMAIKKDGTLWSWGLNSKGQLGDGTTVDKLIPTKIGTGTDWLTTSGGYYHTVALKKDGTLWSWGNNTYGQLGDDTTEDKLIPTKIGIGANWMSISCGMYFTTALKKDGTLWSWGSNIGNLGDGTEINKLIPTKIGTDTDWSSVSCGANHTMALKKDGSLWSCGTNKKGQLGDGTIDKKLIPTKIGTDTDWLIISPFANGTSAIKKDGTLWLWGDNRSSYSTRPVMLKRRFVDSQSHGTGNIIILSSDGTLMVKGTNYFGELGLGHTNVVKDLTLMPNINNCMMISCGTRHTAALKKDGSLWLWGDNEYGQLGDRTIDDRLTPIRVDGVWKDVKCGDSLTAAINDDGSVYVWGEHFGSTPVELTERVGTDEPTPLSGATKLSSGGSIILVHKEDKTVWGIGYNFFGELGNNYEKFKMIDLSKFTYHMGAFILEDESLWYFNGYSSEPAMIKGKWKYVSVGKTHAVGIKSDGSLWSWGEDSSTYQLGQTNYNNTFPLNIGQVGTQTNWISVACGDGFTLALDGYGDVWGWGRNDLNQLGINNTQNQDKPVRIAEGYFRRIYAGNTFGVIVSDSNMYRFGYGQYGELGEIGTTTLTSPTAISLPTSASLYSILISVGTDHVVCTDDMTIYSWGNNDRGQVGIISDTNTLSTGINTFVLDQIEGLGQINQVECGHKTTVLLCNYRGNYNSGASILVGWGYDNGYSIYGNYLGGSTPTMLRGLNGGMDNDRITNVKAGKGQFIYIDAGICVGSTPGIGVVFGYPSVQGENYPAMRTYHSIANKISDDLWDDVQTSGYTTFYKALDGTLYGSGSSNNGSLSSYVDESYYEHPHFVNPIGVIRDAKGPDMKVQSILRIYEDSFQFLVSNEVYLWGSLYNKYEPVKMNSDIKDEGIISMSTYGQGAMFAVDKDGSTWEYGAPGIIKNIDYKGTFRKLDLKDIDTMDLGSAHSVAIKKDGTLWSWGNNTYGQLGDGTTVDKSSPIMVGTDTDWSSVSCGYYHTVALKKDGTLWSWGGNQYGQLGDGTTVTKKVPTKIGMVDDWSSVSCGGYHTMALKKDGSLWAWGNNNSGQLGDGTTVDKSSPIMVGTDTDWSSVSCGYYHTVALKKDGTLWSWGGNQYGQLGDGTTVTKKVPTKIGMVDDWLSVSCGDYHTMALKKDGSLWAWGNNTYGQSEVDELIPTRIGTDNDWLSVSCGANHTMTLKKDGSLWSWGSNTYGQLGIDGPGRSTMIKVDTGDVIMQSIYIGLNRSIVIDSKGVVVGCGMSTNGRLPLSSTEVSINRPFDVSYNEMHPRSQGLNRSPKDVSSISVNDRKYVNGTDLSISVPINTFETFMSPSSGALTGTALTETVNPNSKNAYKVSSVGQFIKTSFNIPLSIIDVILNDSLGSIKKNLIEINIRFTAFIEGGSVTITPTAGSTETLVEGSPVSISYDVLNLLDPNNGTKMTSIAQIGKSGETIGSGVVISDPVIEYVFDVYKDGYGTYVPEDVYVEPSTTGASVMKVSFNDDMRGQTNTLTIKRTDDVTSVIQVPSIAVNQLFRKDWVDIYKVGSTTSYIEMVIDLKMYSDNPISNIRKIIKDLRIKTTGMIESSANKNKVGDLTLKAYNQDQGTWIETVTDQNGYTVIPLNSSVNVINPTGKVIVGLFPAIDTSMINPLDQFKMKLEDIEITHLDIVNYDHINVVHIDKGDACVSLEYPPTNAIGVFDKVEVFYKSNPKLTPIADSDDMIILAESDHMLITDIGDVMNIQQGENPYNNPLSQFDYNFNDLLGVIGFDGLTFTGDSVKTNIDSKVKLYNNIIVGASPQRAVKSYNTPVVAIGRSLVYYNGVVSLMLTLVKSIDGVIDTQNGDITRYLTPIEGNVHITEPNSVERKTILTKKLWK